MPAIDNELLFLYCLWFLNIPLYIIIYIYKQWFIFNYQETHPLRLFDCSIVSFIYPDTPPPSDYREILTAESLTQVRIFLLDLIEYAEKLPIYFIYINSCHFKPFIENNNIKKTERGKTLHLFCFYRIFLHRTTKTPS